MATPALISAYQQRVHGPVLSQLTTNSLFAGDDAKARMDAIRSKITQVRSIWQNNNEYNAMVQKLEEHIYHDDQSPTLKEHIRSLLATYHDWADFPADRPAGKMSQPWSFIELYSSSEGHDYLFGLFNDILRMPEAHQDKLLAAAFLTEILTIELYNLRISNIGDPLYANFQGIVFRGMSVAPPTVKHFLKAAEEEDLTKRTFSIPLGFLSTSTARRTMEKFAKRYPGNEEMYWVIHVHGLEPELLYRYEERYPESVVTSICAMPIAQVAEYGESEILLRGAWFHIVGMRSGMKEGHQIHTVEMVMLNTNRDHATEHALHEGDKKIQREYFNDIIRASRYKILASLAKPYSLEESQVYESLEKKALESIKEMETKLSKRIATHQINKVIESDLMNSGVGSVATWIGDSTGISFPQCYLSQRRDFHKAAAEGDWEFVQQVIKCEYDQKQAEWFNYVELSDEVNIENNGFTLMHEMASQGPPPPNDNRRLAAWQYILETMSKCEVWRTMKTSQVVQVTAEDIARAQSHTDLSSMLKPRILHPLSDDVISTLQQQLHSLIRDYAGDYLDGLSFRMPELSVMTEIQEPRLWIPIPGMYGGFLLILEEKSLRVVVYYIVAGKSKSQSREFRLEVED